MISILAEVDRTGNLYACGSVNIWIGLIFLGVSAANIVVFWLALSHGADPDNEPVVALTWFVVALIFFLVTGISSWFLAAYLAEGSCS